MKLVSFAEFWKTEVGHFIHARVSLNIKPTAREKLNLVYQHLDSAQTKIISSGFGPAENKISNGGAKKPNPIPQKFPKKLFKSTMD